MRVSFGAFGPTARPKKGQSGLHVTLGLCIALFGYVASIQAALPPSAETVAPIAGSAPKATLHLAGNDPILTGSVGSLFASAVFTGPNRAEKQARALSKPDPVAIASVFDGYRSGLLAVKMPHALIEDADPADSGQPAATAGPQSGPIAIASIANDPMTAALSAIRDALRLDPIPGNMPGALAYARAVAPPTIFDTPISMSVSDWQFSCLAEAVYFEARSEPYRGQVAVAQVVLNRVKSGLYPNTICAVVYQNQNRRNACQFSFACDGIPEKVTEPDAWKTAKEVAEKVLRGEVYLTEIANATHYHAAYVRPDWARKMKKVSRIGLHLFYRFKGATG
jgi:hypothetical protein